ncbi:MAG: heparan-alpha-glucosaminide N-acetyltransferase domain-containing protein [Cyclobacteriaceae bacterium]
MTTTTIATKRIESIDLLRGAVMILMALDHLRDYFSYEAFLFEPTDIDQTTASLFFTRFITHYCAPVFMLLAGTSAFFVGRRLEKKDLSIWLIKRGLWLMFLELTVVKFAWYFKLDMSFLELSVIWTLGLSMIFLAGFIHLPKKVILTICSIGVLGHNLLDSVEFDTPWLFNLMVIFHELAPLKETGDLSIWVYYPLIPWIFVMPLGYCMGSLYASDFDSVKRKKTLLVLGLTMTVGFFVIRFINVYGDLLPWESQETMAQTIFSFFNVTKYPPSLLYLLITLGPALIFLSSTESLKNQLLDKMVIIGRVPMFYYIIHLFVIHIAALITAALTGWGYDAMILEGWVTELDRLQGYGFNLWVVYLIWVAMTVLILYPLSKVYHDYKFSNRDKWYLSYI